MTNEAIFRVMLLGEMLRVGRPSAASVSRSRSTTLFAADVPATSPAAASSRRLSTAFQKGDAPRRPSIVSSSPMAVQMTSSAAGPPRGRVRAASLAVGRPRFLLDFPRRSAPRQRPPSQTTLVQRPRHTKAVKSLPDAAQAWRQHV